MNRDYIAFISYRHIARDAAIAKAVHTQIENYTVPKSLRKDSKKLGVVFRDTEELPISSDLSESLRNALDASRFLIVICSPEAKESPWVSREIDYFLKNHSHRDVFVILSSGEPSEVFPYQLTHVSHGSDESCEDIEPLALDVRADTISGSVKRVKKQIKKLYAAMIGCSYDDLVQREKARQRKRALCSVVALIVVLSCFAAIVTTMNRKLTETNVQLEIANRETVMQESQRLSADAATALENGDHMAAIEYATNALYSKHTDKPYTASAERTLFSAMNIFGNETNKLLLKKVEILHSAPIDMMTYSEAGNQVYVIDSYGNVACYDSVSGSVVWNTKIEEPESFSYMIHTSQIYLDRKANILICCYKGQVSGIDASTGTPLWRYAMKNEMVHGVIFDEQRQEVAFIEQIYTLSPDFSESYYNYNFIVIATKTGTELHKIALPGAQYPDLVYFPRNSKTSSGMFADSNRFVGTLFTLNDGVCRSLLYVIDLTENSVSYIDNQRYEAEIDGWSYLQTFYTGSNQAMVLHGEEGLRIQCFDIAQGTLLWEIETGEDKYIPTNQKCYFIPWGTDSLITAGSFMCLVDGTNGTVLSSVSLHDNIIELYPIEAGVFGFHLANGYCAVGWANDYGLNDSNWYGVTADLPNTPMTISYNHGLIHPKIETEEQNGSESKFLVGFAAAAIQEGGGSIVYLSEDRCIAYVTTVLPKIEVPEFEPFWWGDSHVADLGRYLDTNTVSGTVLMGPADLNDSDQRGLIVIDVTNHSASFIGIEQSVAAYADYFLLSSDGNGIIAGNSSGDIWYTSMDGSQNNLAESENIVLYETELGSFWASRYAAASTRQLSDGNVLTARCDGESIEMWYDGTTRKVVDVPDNVQWATSDIMSRQHMFAVGANGLIILSHYPDASTKSMQSFAVYNTAHKEWTTIRDIACGADDRTIGFGQVTQLFAVYDVDRCIRVYDWDSADCSCSIKADFAENSVLEIGMIFNDQYVYVATQDGQFAVYSLSSGTAVFRTSFGDFYTGQKFSVWCDRNNNRLYIGAGMGCVCVDIRSWESIFKFENTDFFAFYSEYQNEVYRIGLDHEGYTSRETLEFLHVPTTEELIDKALDTLE